MFPKRVGRERQVGLRWLWCRSTWTVQPPIACTPNRKPGTLGLGTGRLDLRFDWTEDFVLCPMIGSLLHNDELSTIQVVPGTVGSGLVETFVGEIPPPKNRPRIASYWRETSGW